MPTAPSIWLLSPLQAYQAYGMGFFSEEQLLFKNPLSNISKLTSNCSGSREFEAWSMMREEEAHIYERATRKRMKAFSCVLHNACIREEKDWLAGKGRAINF